MNDVAATLSQTSVGQALLMGTTVLQRAPGNADPTGITDGLPDGLTLFWDDAGDVKVSIWSATLGAWKTLTAT